MGALKKEGAVTILQTIYMLLHSCDYHKKISINMNKATDEGNSRNEIGH